MSDLDDLIRSDLSVFGGETARSIPDFSTVSAELAGAGGPYRDSEPGAEARRRAEQEQRVSELALMPLAYERVFVHRVSRAAAGAVALAGVAGLVVMSMDGFTQRLVHLVVGQPTAAFLAAALAFKVLAAYVFAGLIAERYYEKRMRVSIGSGAGPLEEARRLLERVDAAAVALPLAGAVSGGLLLGLLAFFSDPGYSALALTVEAADVLVPASFVGVVAALLLGGACARDRRDLDGSPVLRAAEHWVTLVAGGAAVIASLWYAARTSFGLHALGIIPNSSTSMALGAVGLAALIMPTSWLILWLRRREARRLGAPS
jgi:hypothetical protein